MARPTKYNPETAGKIIGLVQAGANRTDAAQAAGIGETTFQSWMKRYPEFRAGVMEADAASVSIAENSLRKKNPLAYLQAKRPKMYGNLGKSTVEITGRDGGAIEIEHGISDSAILAFADYLRDSPEDSSGSG